ncbi:MAG: hypothetical protein U1F76_18340 [Candidatus Competibacteraceae bacterium]
MNDANVRPVVVTIDDQHIPAIQSVARALEAGGLRVSNILSTVGIISGSIPLANIDALKAIPGVVDVELDQEMHALGARDK